MTIKRVALIAVFAMLASGCSMLSWGRNSFGQLGTGDTSSATVPQVAEAGAVAQCGQQRVLLVAQVVMGQREGVCDDPPRRSLHAHRRGGHVGPGA